LNCRQALRLLYEVLDKEASQRDVAEVEKHLTNCRHCMARYEFERLFLALVVNKGRTTRNNIAIKDRIRAQLDAIDAAGEVSSSPSPFRWAAVAIATAAALVLCILASFWVSDFYNYQTQILPFINAYYAHANSGATTDYGIDPIDYLSEQIGIKMDASQLPLEHIRSVSVDTIKGIEFGCLELSDPHRSDAMISIFVTDADNYHLPDKPCRRINGREMLVHTCKHCSMIGDRRGDLVFLVLAEPRCRPDELAQLASAL
jgi:anti-sigma factor (TIGR02949 family)